MTTSQRWFSWLAALSYVIEISPVNILPSHPGKASPPFWVRWPLGWWVMGQFRRDPEQWLQLAIILDGMRGGTDAEQIGRGIVARALRDFAEEREPGIQRRMWAEQQEWFAENEAIHLVAADESLR